MTYIVIVWALGKWPWWNLFSMACLLVGLSELGGLGIRNGEVSN